MKIELTPDVWRVVHAVVVEAVMPRYRALAALEQALQAAQEVPAEEADKEPTE